MYIERHGRRVPNPRFRQVDGQAELSANRIGRLGYRPVLSMGGGRQRPRTREADVEPEGMRNDIDELADRVAFARSARFSEGLFNGRPVAGHSLETLIATYARRSSFGSMFGPGFESPRLH